ncbi:MAG: hypothetical protein M3Y08_01845, partial [Fibrobacterota bacterium]|nr:hypothetical protein [Fibrobacterota bacterium]
MGMTGVRAVGITMKGAKGLQSGNHKLKIGSQEAKSDGFEYSGGKLRIMFKRLVAGSSVSVLVFQFAVFNVQSPASAQPKLTLAEALSLS